MSISIVLPTLHGMGWNAADRRERWNPKRCGELSEAAFLLKATEQGFLVAKPWGDSDMYDFILDSGTRLWRVQLKSTAVLQQRGYHVNMMHNAYGKGKVGYKAEDIDMLVAHIPPLEIWYVLPVTVFAPLSSSGSIQISGSGPAAGRGIARLGDCSPASLRNSTRSWVADLPILPSCTQRNRN
jgi:hypothetical protein